jgi:hypothetical protein
MTSPSATSAKEPGRDEIALRARQLWEHYGRPQGRDYDIWLEAERQITGHGVQPVEHPSGAVPADPLNDAVYPLTSSRDRDRAGEPAATRPSNNEASTGRPPI